MCTQPIKIINPKLKAKHSNWDPKADPLFLKIACGKCQDCQNKKQQDYITRLAYEFEYTKATGGYVLFETFTYNEQNVPHLHGLMCFNKDHYKSFAKELRVYLVRHYEKIFKKYNMGNELFQIPYTYTYTYNEREEDIEEETGLWSFSVKLNKNQPVRPEYHPAGNIKIFWVSEYGGEYKRPHYHALIFVQYKINPQTMCYYIKKSWKYGFTDARKAEEKICNSMKSIAYVAKYVCKDIEWAKTLTSQKGSTFKKYLQKRWLQVYGEEMENDIFEKLPCESTKRILKEINMDSAIPYIRVSRHLGEYGLNKIYKNNLEKNECVIWSAKQGTEIVPIPMYLKRKKLYDYDSNIKFWQLNDLGKIIKANEQETTISKTITEIENTFKYYINNISNYNKEYYKKMYADIKSNKTQYQKLIMLIYNRDMLITRDIINYLKNGDIINNIELRKQEIINKSKVTKYSHNVPWDWLLKIDLRKEVYTTEEYLKENKISDKRYKELIIVYDDIQEKILQSMEQYKLEKKNAEFAIKQQKIT